MSEPTKASGWHYTPALPVRPAPYWDRPARPLAALIYLVWSWRPVSERALFLLIAIGIGASKACDGQILVTEDMLSFYDGHRPKFVRPFADLNQDIAAAAQAYRQAGQARYKCRNLSQ